jgi:uncharacterized MnhB-related membrane protein
MTILDLVLLLLLITLALAVVFSKDLLAATMIFSVYSLVMAIIFTRLQSPDVALTEATVGAGITTMLFIVTIIKTTRREDDEQD